MPVPDFSPGEVLTAAAMDSIGLWLVKSQAVGTGVSSVTVTGAFSADYDSYLITWQSGTMSGDTALKLQLGSIVTGYYGTFIYGTTAGGLFVAADNNTSIATYGGGGVSIGAISSLVLFNPNKAIRTSISSQYIAYSANFGTYQGVENSTTQHTDFTLIPFSGTMTGGTIRVYGYRN